MQALGRMRQQVAVLRTVQRWTGTPSHTTAIAASSPGVPSTITNLGRRSPRRTRSSSTAGQASVLPLPMALTASKIFVRKHADYSYALS